MHPAGIELVKGKVQLVGIELTMPPWEGGILPLN